MEPRRQGSGKDPAGNLEPGVRAALRHPARRQILRALCTADRTWSPSELSKAGKVSCSVSCVSCHMRVLKSHGLVNLEASEPTRGALKHYFSAAVAENSPILALLRETERSDRRPPAAPAS